MGRASISLVAPVTVAALGGCVRPEVPAGPPAPEPASEPAAKADAPEPAPIRFWVAGDGLAAYDLDGERVASLAETGDEARRLADGRVIVLDDADDGLWLAVLDPEGEPGPRVAIPRGFDPETCTIASATADPEDFEPLNLQDARGFAIDPSHDAACLTIQDRNDNMADYGLSVAVELATGELTSMISLDLQGGCEGEGEGGPACEDFRKLEIGEPWIEPAEPPAAASEAWPVSFADDRHVLIREGVERARLCEPGAAADDDYAACAELEASSPSGRWLLLSGKTAEGDYIYRDVVLLDRQTGELLMIREDYEQPPSFADVTPGQIFADDPGFAALCVVGESELEWLPGDRLWIDGRLLIPERRAIVEIGGRLARRL